MWRSSAIWRRCLAYTFSTGASARPVGAGHLRCVRRVRHADQHRPAGISHGTSVYLPFNIAIRSLVPRTACTARVDIDPWAGGPGWCDGCDGGRNGRRVPLGLLGHARPRRSSSGVFGDCRAPLGRRSRDCLRWFGWQGCLGRLGRLGRGRARRGCGGRRRLPKPKRRIFGGSQLF